MPDPKLGASLLATLALQLGAGEASAFCRQRTCSDRTERVCDNFQDPSDCVSVQKVCVRDADGCITEGAPLSRPSGCLGFAVARGNAQGFGLHDTEVVPIIEEAFARWSEVDCGGGLHPAFSAQSVGLVTASGAYYCAEQSLNIGAWFLTKPWTRDPSMLGNTVTTWGRESGEVFDADVEINVDKILGEFSGQDRRAILLAIATHEAGHFLGLSHSSHQGSMMHEAYGQTGLSARTLSEDDIAGICAIFPPTATPLECGVPGVSPAALEPGACEAALSQTSASGGGTALGEPAIDGEPGPKGCAVAATGPRSGGLFAPFGFLLLSLGLTRRGGLSFPRRLGFGPRTQSRNAS